MLVKGVYDVIKYLISTLLLFLIRITDIALKGAKGVLNCN